MKPNDVKRIRHAIRVLYDVGENPEALASCLRKVPIRELTRAYEVMHDVLKGYMIRDLQNYRSMDDEGGDL